MTYIEKNQKIWDRRSENNDRWAVPVSAEEVQLAREGRWNIVLTPTKPVPASWFPAPLKGKKILCLASGGGQQGPILAAAGAEVTVFDNSRVQLGKDELVAKREQLSIRTVQGNMQDLSAFADKSFDCIVHPWSNGYIDDVKPVWRECARVLKKGGLLLAGFGNPISCIFHVGQFEKGVLQVTNAIPYADADHLDDPETRAIAEADGYLWGHTLEDQIQGQISAGFAIIGMYEDIGGCALDPYIPSSMATKAIKL